ncbi:MAG: hypothetical protein KAI77_01405, partial [Gammaproteobacteria bacterium]|nr:hypothetical protein [Gammaproteobacteria bacterium]
MTKKPEDIKQEDQNLEDYLQGDSPLSKAYRAEEKAQPPVHLDKVIVAASNEAIRSEQTSNIAYSPFARTWYVPASMGAVLVLCVGLVFTIYQNTGQTLLTAPKSEYDFDKQIVPMPMAVEPVESEESQVSGEKRRQLEYADEIQDEAEILMDVISEENRPVPPSIESYGAGKSEVQQRATSKILLKGKASGMDDASLPETAPAITDELIPKKDASKQMMSDSPHIQERSDVSGRLEAADIKKQKQLDANVLKSNLGEMELKVIEQGAGLDQEPHYRQAIEDQLKQNESLSKEILDKETLDSNKTAGGVISPEKSTGNEMMTPEDWLKQINNLWVSGDHQIAKENLTL